MIKKSRYTPKKRFNLLTTSFFAIIAKTRLRKTQILPFRQLRLTAISGSELKGLINKNIGKTNVSAKN